MNLSVSQSVIQWISQSAMSVTHWSNQSFSRRIHQESMEGGPTVMHTFHQSIIQQQLSQSISHAISHAVKGHSTRAPISPTLNQSVSQFVTVNQSTNQQFIMHRSICESDWNQSGFCQLTKQAVSLPVRKRSSQPVSYSVCSQPANQSISQSNSHVLQTINNEVTKSLNKINQSTNQSIWNSLWANRKITQPVYQSSNQHKSTSELVYQRVGQSVSEPSTQKSI